MKRLIAAVALMIALLGAVAVEADVIWEPFDDSFFAKHRSECAYEDLSYIARGPAGKVIVYAAPDDSREEGSLPNDTHFYVTWTCVYADQKWGYFAKDGMSGWVPMVYLYREFDSSLFNELYASQLVSSYEPIVSDTSVIKDETVEIYFWSYPGSDQYFTRRFDTAYLNDLCYNTKFVDEQGREWGFVGYYMGHMDSWVCLDAPFTDPVSLYPEGFLNRDNRDIVDYSGSEVSPSADRSLIWITIGVVIVCAVGVLLLLRLRKDQAVADGDITEDDKKSEVIEDGDQEL